MLNFRGACNGCQISGGDSNSTNFYVSANPQVAAFGGNRDTQWCPCCPLHWHRGWTSCPITSKERCRRRLMNRCYSTSRKVATSLLPSMKNVRQIGSFAQIGDEHTKIVESTTQSCCKLTYHILSNIIQLRSFTISPPSTATLFVSNGLEHPPWIHAFLMGSCYTPQKLTAKAPENKMKMDGCGDYFHFGARPIFRGKLLLSGTREDIFTEGVPLL